jgi:hypothetical protein
MYIRNVSRNFLALRITSVVLVIGTAAGCFYGNIENTSLCFVALICFACIRLTKLHISETSVKIQRCYLFACISRTYTYSRGNSPYQIELYNFNGVDNRLDLDDSGSAFGCLGFLLAQFCFAKYRGVILKRSKNVIVANISIDEREFDLIRKLT